jgi:hypothetical protein
VRLARVKMPRFVLLEIQFVLLEMWINIERHAVVA